MLEGCFERCEPPPAATTSIARKQDHSGRLDFATMRPWEPVVLRLHNNAVFQRNIPSGKTLLGALLGALLGTLL